jgi:hypothetical protein
MLFANALFCIVAAANAAAAAAQRAAQVAHCAHILRAARFVIIC